MDGFFGLGLFFAVISGITVVVPAVFILSIAFVYVRQQRGQPVDITTGVSAYAVILIGLGALLVTFGVAQMLTAIMAEIDGDYTYGVADFGFNDFPGAEDFEDEDVSDRQERDVATGMALFVAGALAVAGHVWLRGWLSGHARFDRGVEGAWDTLFALLIGLTAIFFVAAMLTDTFGRAIADNDTSATGRTIAQMIAVLGLWAVYAYRALGHTGLLVSNREGGPHGGKEI
ncbi:MAG: hypothetical protein WD557_09305 [Dehalococcoidia bacterium]